VPLADCIGSVLKQAQRREKRGARDAAAKIAYVEKHYCLLPNREKGQEA